MLEMLLVVAIVIIGVQAVMIAILTDITRNRQNK